MDPKLEIELADLANSPMSLHELEYMELGAIESMMRPDDPGRARAKVILRMTAEIRKARGQWHESVLTDNEIDNEIAEIRGLS